MEYKRKGNICTDRKSGLIEEFTLESGNKYFTVWLCVCGERGVTKQCLELIPNFKITPDLTG